MNQKRAAVINEVDVVEANFNLLNVAENYNLNENKDWVQWVINGG